MMLTIGLVISQLVTNVGAVSVKAATNYNAYYDEFEKALSDRCIEFQGYLADTGSKQFGLLYSMRILGSYQMYVEFMGEYYKKLGISSREVSMYEADLHDRLETFNDKYGETSKDFEKLKLDVNFTGKYNPDKDDEGRHSTARNDIKKNLIAKYPAYIDKILGEVQSDISKAGSDTAKVNEVKAENTTLVTNVYQIYTALTSAEEDLNSYTPFEDDTQVTYELKSDGKTLKDALESVLSKYNDLVDLAKKALNAETEDEITVDLTASYVDNLSNAETNSNGVEIPKNAKLDPLYYAIMAASAVYVPFQSYAGNSEFQAALKSLTNDDEMQNEIVEFYSATKDIRKPLYKREFDDKGYPTGTAKLMTIQDFIDDIEEDRSGALCTVLGEFNYDNNTGAWMYKQGSDRNTVEFDYDSIQEKGSSNNLGVESDDGSGTESDGSTAVQQESSNSILASVSEGILGKHASAATAEPADEETAEDNGNDEEDTGEEGEDSSQETASPDSDGVVNDDKATSNASEDEDTTIADQAVFAYEEITDDTKLSEPLLMYGSDYVRAIDNTTSMILTNALKNCSNLNDISDKSTRYIYVNAYGDIVTDDNMIILPGIANPLLYNSDSKYNPYTVAFMNAYPKAFKKSNVFKLSNQKDIGKYVIVKQSSDRVNDSSVYAIKTDSISGIKTSTQLSLVDLNTSFKISGGSSKQALKYTTMQFADSSNWNKGDKAKTLTPLVAGDSLQAEGITIFPYVSSEDSGYNVAKTIANAMYTYLMTDEKTGNGENLKSKFNENYILHNFLLSGLNGTNNPKGYSTDTLKQYDRFVAGASERFLNKVKALSETILSTASEVRGVIGLRDALQNPVVGRILMYCRSNLILFVLGVVLILLIAFSKMRVDLFQLVMKGIACIAVAVLFITIVPTYMPMLFNVVINNVSETMSYKILATRTENESIGNKNDLNDDGSEDLTASSLTLYRAGVLNYKEFVNSVNVDEDEIVGGNTETINQEAGLFVEGDAIKISTTKLFNTLKIADTTKESNGLTLHQLKAYKTIANNVDYYTPYYQIVDGFIDKMNKLEEISEIPRATITYPNGTVKDNYLVYSYVNSKVFLTPGEYLENVGDKTDWTDSEYEQLQKDAKAYAKELEDAFGSKQQATDFLGVADFLYNPTDAMKQTIWYQTMVRENYYASDGTVNRDKMDNLITYINYQTKKFIYSMESQIGKLSDDTMIKIISLRALTAFTQKVSQYGDWLYPYSLNYGEISLGDVLSNVFISDYAQYTLNNMDVVEYIGSTKGWFHLVIFDFLLIALFVLVYVVQWLVYLMYLLLGVALVLKILAQGNVAVPMKGFLKCSGIIAVCYTLLTVAFAGVNKVNGKTIGIYVMILVVAIIIYVITMVISSIASNLLDVGNSAINVKVAGIGNLANIKNSFKQLTAKSLVANRESVHNRLSQTERNSYSNYDRYNYDSDVDDSYYDSIGGYYDDKIVDVPNDESEDSEVSGNYSEFTDDLRSPTVEIETEDDLTIDPSTVVDGDEDITFRE